MLRMQFNQQCFFFLGPFFLFDSNLEMIVVSLTTLFAIATFHTIESFHHPWYLTPFFDSALFIEFLQNLIFLSWIMMYFLLPDLSLAHCEIYAEIDLLINYIWNMRNSRKSLKNGIMLGCRWVKYQKHGFSVER